MLPEEVTRLARRAEYAAIVLAAVLAPGRARADDAVQQCVDEHRAGQAHRQGGRLREARDLFASCARTQCPEPIALDCSTWLGEVKETIPTVVLRARLPDGSDAVAVRVTLDGKPWVERLDGRPLEIDPGVHALRFETRGAPAQLVPEVVIAAGEKLRRIEVRFEGPPRSASISERPVPPAAIVAGAVGLVGLAGFTYFGLTGNATKADLDDSGCYPRCDPDEVSSARRSWIAADISLGVGVVGLGLATYFFLSRPVVEQPQTSGSSPPSASSARARRSGALGRGLQLAW